VLVPGSYNQQITAFDINNNGLVELPFTSDPNNIDTNYEYTKPQVLKHTITHEMGHAVGMGHNSDSTCVMYEYSNNWSRDGKFSSYAIGQMSIHNP
jgi:predicted Zn-dependent protease